MNEPTHISTIVAGLQYDELEREAPDEEAMCTTCGHPEDWCTCGHPEPLTREDVAEYLAR